MADGVRKISNHTLVKATWDLGARHLEASSFEFVRTRTTIPIPRMRAFIDENNCIINVMDYMPGERLDHIWPPLSLWTKLRVTLTLRRHIRRLRVKSIPRPVADSPQRLDSYVLYNPGIPDYVSLSAFYNRSLT